MISQRLVEDGIIEGNSILTIPDGENENGGIDENGDNFGSNNHSNNSNVEVITAVEKAALRNSQRVKSPLAVVENGDEQNANANANANAIQEGVPGEEGEGDRSVGFSQKLYQCMNSIISFLRKVGSHYVYRGVFLVCLLLDLLFLSLAILGFIEYRLW